MSTLTSSGTTWRIRSAGAALAALLGLFFLPDFTGHKLADWSYALPFHFRPELAPEAAMIIYMDDASAKGLNQAWDEREWDRRLHAQLIHRLVQAGARAIVFDVLFDAAGTNDAAFLAAVEAATNRAIPVVVAGEFTVEKQSVRRTDEKVVPPFDALMERAAWGLAERADEATLRHSHFGGAHDLPSLAWRAAQLTGTKALPDGAETRWINFYGPPGVIPSQSFKELLNPDFDLRVCSNKVCFIGAKPGTTLPGGRRVDAWDTPYSRTAGRMPGVEITATVYLNLLRGDWLQRMPKLLETILLVVAGAVMGLGFTGIRPMTAVGLGGLFAILMASVACWLALSHETWFSWLIVSLVQVPTATVWSVLAFTKQLGLEKASLEQQLATTTATIVPAASRPPPPLAAAAPAQSVAPAAVAAATSRARPDRRPDVPDHDLLLRIGRGAYGEVWLARNAIGTYHAVKIVWRDSFEQEAPFEREFKGLQKFMPISRSHPGLVQILHVGRRTSEGFIYYIMEAADDENTGPQIQPEAYAARSLARELRRRRTLPALECIELGIALSGALAFLHEQNLVHRDIKPANIIFVKGAPKFADIGLVTEVARTGREVTYLGTPGYIPPEGPGTAAADVYGLGKVLYEASMGLDREQFPELSGTLIQRPDAPLAFQLNHIILKASHSEVAQRYQSAAELRQDLLGLLQRAG